MAEAVHLAAAILCGMLIVFDCTSYNQGVFGKQCTSCFCCYKSPGPKYNECLIKMLKRRKERKKKKKDSIFLGFKCSGYIYIQ